MSNASHPTPSVSRCEASREGPRMRRRSEEKIPLFITSVFLMLSEPCCFGCWNTNSLQTEGEKMRSRGFAERRSEVRRRGIKKINK